MRSQVSDRRVDLAGGELWGLSPDASHLLDWAERVIEGELLPREAAAALLEVPNKDLLLLIHAAYVIRRHFYGNAIKLNMLINAKSGLCPEDCGYCSQSVRSTAPIPKYSYLSKETLLEGAAAAASLRASTYCIVASGRGPTDREIELLTESVREIKAKYPLRICACLGLLKEDQAKRLKEAGVDRYNHNLNTSERHHPEITTTHQYRDRVATIERVKAHQISPCAGIIVGMGEKEEDLLDLAYHLRSLGADSIPVNFLHPIEGTPLGSTQNSLTPTDCLKVLAMFRFVCPSKEIRVAGGREVNLRTLQPLALYIANSIFIGDYLTTKGQEPKQDVQMIADLGFDIEEIFRE